MNFLLERLRKNPAVWSPEEELWCINNRSRSPEQLAVVQSSLREVVLGEDTKRACPYHSGTFCPKYPYMDNGEVMAELSTKDLRNVNQSLRYLTQWPFRRLFSKLKTLGTGKWLSVSFACPNSETRGCTSHSSCWGLSYTRVAIPASHKDDLSSYPQIVIHAAVEQRPRQVAKDISSIIQTHFSSAILLLCTYYPHIFLSYQDQSFFGLRMPLGRVPVNSL